MLLDAVKMLGELTNNRFTLWSLMGQRNAALRAKLMGVLVGKKMPQSKSGVTMLRDEFHKHAKVNDHHRYDCAAVRDEYFIQWCKQLLLDNNIP